MNTTTRQTSSHYAISNPSNNTDNHPTDHPVATPNIPTRPNSLPYSPAADDTPKLEEYLKTHFASSVFNRGPPFPKMNTQPAHTYLKDNAILHTNHIRTPIPHHWKNQVKASLDAEYHSYQLEPIKYGAAK